MVHFGVACRHYGLFYMPVTHSTPSLIDKPLIVTEARRLVESWKGCSRTRPSCRNSQYYYPDQPHRSFGWCVSSRAICSRFRRRMLPKGPISRVFTASAADTDALQSGNDVVTCRLATVWCNSVGALVRFPLSCRSNYSTSVRPRSSRGCVVNSRPP
jgi:hypothetical protein